MTKRCANTSGVDNKNAITNNLCFQFQSPLSDEKAQISASNRSSSMIILSCNDKQYCIDIIDT